MVASSLAASSLRLLRLMLQLTVLFLPVPIAATENVFFFAIAASFAADASEDTAEALSTIITRLSLLAS